MLMVVAIMMNILCLWFRASLIYINNCPTRCNTKQSIYYSASSLYMFRVSAAPIVRSTQNCNYSLRYWSRWREVAAPVPEAVVTVLCTLMMGVFAWPRWREVAAPVLEAVVTVLCTPDDGYGWNPKHVKWTCRIINRLLCVASRWKIINNEHIYGLFTNAKNKYGVRFYLKVMDAWIYYLIFESTVYFFLGGGGVIELVFSKCDDKTQDFWTRRLHERKVMLYDVCKLPIFSQFLSL